jgi:hypothetical protein
MAGFTSAQLDALELAIAEGVRVVKYADKSVEYRSLDEMCRIRDLMRQFLRISSGSAARVKPVFSKGLE